MSWEMVETGWHNNRKLEVTATKEIDKKWYLYTNECDTLNNHWAGPFSTLKAAKEYAEENIKKNCLTCRWANVADFAHDGRPYVLDCLFPVPDNMPESWKNNNPDISFYGMDEGYRDTPYVSVTHIEYFDEREITDCKGYEKGKINVGELRNYE